MRGYFGSEWDSPELWQDQTNPVPSPLLDVDTVYPDNFVELPGSQYVMPQTAPAKLPRWVLIGGAAVAGSVAAAWLFGRHK